MMIANGPNNKVAHHTVFHILRIDEKEKFRIQITCKV